jgi:hypothetical protein
MHQLMNELEELRAQKEVPHRGMSCSRGGGGKGEGRRGAFMGVSLDRWPYRSAHSGL